MNKMLVADKTIRESQEKIEDLKAMIDELTKGDTITAVTYRLHEVECKNEIMEE